MVNHDRQTDTFPWNRSDAMAVLFLGVGVIWAIHRFWQVGIASDADMLMAIYRIFDLHQAWQTGVFYPRLSHNLNFGYGAPLFQYYPPLASYAAMPFVGAGVGYVEAAKAVFTIALAGASAGAYIYARWLFNNRLAALLTALVFLFSPYLLLNVYERGALSETVGMALLPWLFYALHRLIYQPGVALFLLVVFVAAMSILAHNVTALFVTPAMILFVVLVATFDQRPKSMLLPLGALFVGLGLSAFYWLPAIGELGYSRAESFMIGDANASTVSRHLVTPFTLLQWNPIVEYSGPSRFRFGLLHSVLAVLAVAAIYFQKTLPRRSVVTLILMSLVLLFVLLLQLTWFQPLWDVLPLVRFIQFSWRLFGLASFSAAILIGSLLCLSYPSQRWQWFVGVAISAGLILATTYRLSPAQLPGWYEIESKEITTTSLFERGRQGYALFTDYTPASLEIPAEELSLPRSSSEKVMPAAASPYLTLRQMSPNVIELVTDSPTSFPLRIHRTYFPGWQAVVDGERVEATASGAPAVVTANIPEGRHDVMFLFGPTPLRWATGLISAAIALIILAVIIWLALVRRRPQWLIAIMTVVIIFFSVFAISHTIKGDAIKENQVSFGNEIYMLGHRLSHPNGIRSGETLSIDLFWWVPETPSADYTVFFHLVRQDDDGNKIAQSDRQPMLGYNAMTRWESGELVDDLHTINIPAETAPGEYVLLMGVYDPNSLENLPIISEGAVLPGDRFIVTQLQVR